MKKIIKKIIRKFLLVKKDENIIDSINKRKTNFKKRIYINKYDTNTLFKELKNIGIKEGDHVLVQAAWREFYNYEGTPIDIIELLTKMVGEEGTVLMPSYGLNREYFDLSKTPSAAGVLSEVFRIQEDTIRSECTNFSICARGKLANELTKDHSSSSYGFDQYSPLYKLAQQKNGKILFLGLGSKPTKISLFHCAGFILRDEIVFFRNLYSEVINCVLIANNIKHEKKMIVRNPIYKNNNKVIKKIFNSIDNKEISKLSNLDIVTIDAGEGLQRAIEFAKRGQYCYKKNQFY